MQQLKFEGNHSAFYAELKSRVQQYFKTKNLPTVGDGRIILKAIIFIGLLIGSYVTLVFFTPPAWISIILCVLLGVVTAGIGFNVMHDGGHGTFSKSKKINRLAALSLNFLGCSSFFWNIKHNIVHHTFTNVAEHDDDIENEPFLRMTDEQKLRGMHRYQHIYWLFVYGLMYIGWIFLLDFKKYFSRRIGARENVVIPVKHHFGFWFTKVFYTLVFVVLPIYMVGWMPFLIGYSIYMFVTGVIISVIFQLAHAVENTDFLPSTSTDGIIHNDWAIHQLATTCNFSTRSKIMTFFTGGLNFQVEHHLFPKVSHVFYTDINKIVRDVCQKYNIRYNEQPTLLKAVVSHVKYLKKMGRS